MIINLAEVPEKIDPSAKKIPAGVLIREKKLDIPAEDVQILRDLARRKHELSQNEKFDYFRRIWTATNDLRMEKPPIYINEICWNEFRDIEYLHNRCTHPVAQMFETFLRKEIFMVENELGNFIMNDYIEAPMVIYDSDFGIDEQVDIAKTDETSAIVSRHFNVLIEDWDDIEKIHMPEIYICQDAQDALEAKLHEIFDGIIPVKLVGSRGKWFTPWDFLIRVTGIEDVMINMYEDPDFVEAITKRYVDCSMERMRRWRELGIWASNVTAERVGSGGYGYISCLDKADDSNNLNCDTKQMWGCGNAQIFSDVSPEMHWQFSMQYEMEWLKQFGVTYYGCCEPLYGKIDILRRIPNLRKISMSPWNDLKIASERIGKDYVMSVKPNPAIFAERVWDADRARKTVRQMLEDTRTNNLEFIVKDISTVCYEPQRLIDFAHIAQEEIDRMYC